MYQTDNIIDKAKQLGLNVSENSNQLDTLRAIASQVGMSNFDLDKSDELEQILDEKLNNQNNSNNDANVSQDNIENLDTYPQDNPYYNNSSNERQPFGKDAYDATKGEHGHDKDYYKNQKEDLEKKKEEAEKAKEEADKKKEEAASKKEEAKGTDNSKDVNREYKGAKREARQANKDLKNVNKDLRSNKVNDFKNNFYKATHPGEVAKDAVKDKAKEVAGNAGKKVANAAGNAAKAGAKAAGQAAKAGVQAVGHAIATFVAANPWILAVIGVLVLILFILLLLMATGDDDSEYYGYYAPSCDITLYNESNSISVTYDYGNTIEGETYTLKELVVAQAYYHLSNIYDSYDADELNYSDEVIEAMLVVIQTNVLLSSFQDESAEEDEDRLIYSMPEYMEDVMAALGSGSFDDELYNDISNLYDNVESNMYVQSDYDTTYLNNLQDLNMLSVDYYLDFPALYVKSILDAFKSYDGTTDLNGDGEADLGDRIYTYYQNSDYYLFSVEEDCDYYTLTDNTAYWWPIGSSEETATNIYGGTPTSTVINSSFGARDMSGYGGSSENQHNGIDIDGEMGETIVIAAQSGMVIATNDTCSSTGSYGSTCGGGLGNFVKIEHEDGTITIYGHMYQGSISVSKGDSVAQGQMLGLVGSSGSSTGAHLHFGVQVNDEYVDPLDYVSATNPRPVSTSMDNISTTYVSGSTNKETVCKTLLASGYSESAVAGLMVNIYAESGYSPINLQNSYETSLGYTDTTYTMAINAGTYTKTKFVEDSAGYGLAQWTSSGKKGRLYDFATSYSSILSIGDMEMQLAFLTSEMSSSSYSEIAKYLTGNYSAYDVAYAFCTKYEKPKDTTTTCKNRATNYAESIYAYVQNGCSE